MRRILEALREILAGIVNVFAWPAKAFTNLFGLDRRDEDEPEQRAAKAGTAAQKEADEEDRDALLRRQARSLQRVLDARLAGEEPPKAALAKLPEAVKTYVMGLNQDEVAIAARAPRSSLIVAVAGEGIPGIRTPAEVRHDAADARRAALEVVEGGPQPAATAKPKDATKQPAARDVNAILADMGLEAPRRMGM